ncbi:MAG TPA: hypothetical protein VMH86_07135 [Rhizomicrobium sp.]|nr:hypothetical protein [Rhizomicrobium sp.]
MRNLPFILILSTLAAAAACADTLPAPRGMPCRQGNGAALDFWIGDWAVTDPDGTKAGENRVERLLDGCAVIEHWHGAGAGDDGMSLFSYDARRGTWEQTWVTPDTARPGGLKHKTMIARRADGSVVFQGTIVTQTGALLDRTTLSPVSPGHVRQLIEWSRDGGRSWKTVFDGRYARQ